MSSIFDLIAPNFSTGLNEAQITACNATTSEYGLTLSAEKAHELDVEHADLLAKHDRVEFGTNTVIQLIDGFASSPFMQQDSYAETLSELQERFYDLRSQAGVEVFDEEIIDGMRLLFDGDAGGSTELLRTCTLDMVIEAYDTQTGSLAERNREVIENQGPVSDVPSYEWNISEVIGPENDDDLSQIRFNEQEWHDNVTAPGFDGESWSERYE